MTSELMSLTAVTALTAVLWMPYVLNIIVVRGLMDAVGYPEDFKAWIDKVGLAEESH